MVLINGLTISLLNLINGLLTGGLSATGQHILSGHLNIY